MLCWAALSLRLQLSDLHLTRGPPTSTNAVRTPDGGPKHEIGRLLGSQVMSLGVHCEFLVLAIPPRDCSARVSGGTWINQSTYSTGGENWACAREIGKCFFFTSSQHRKPCNDAIFACWLGNTRKPRATECLISTQHGEFQYMQCVRMHPAFSFSWRGIQPMFHVGCAQPENGVALRPSGPWMGAIDKDPLAGGAREAFGGWEEPEDPHTTARYRPARRLDGAVHHPQGLRSPSARHHAGEPLNRQYGAAD